MSIGKGILQRKFLLSPKESSIPNLKYGRMYSSITKGMISMQLGWGFYDEDHDTTGTFHVINYTVLTKCVKKGPLRPDTKGREWPEILLHHLGEHIRDLMKC